MSLFSDQSVAESRSSVRAPEGSDIHSIEPREPKVTREPLRYDGEELHAEDLTVGDSWTSEYRQITADDVSQFAMLTGDHDPLHGDAAQGDSAKQSPYGKPIVHGLLGLSVLAGLGSNYPRASTLAFVGIEDWQFVAPVFFGDAVKVRNEIVAIDPHGRRAVKVRWLRQLINETGRVVQQGYFVTLVGSRGRSTAKPR